MPNARLTDPETSWEAAKSISNLASTKAAILAILAKASMTDYQLVKEFNKQVQAGVIEPASESGIRSRRAELTKLGRVIDTGQREVLPSGRKAIIWAIPIDLWGAECPNGAPF
jgi:hypothetical protein